ncbi:MAG: AI-2E family transporter [Ruminococcaceae bacterium]|nr:AI-2E family transporter [Oscillospiraceae bacterium]
MKSNFKKYINIGLGIFVLYLCIHYWDVAAEFLATVFGAAVPLLIGGMIAYFVNILMSFYERHYFVKSKKLLAEKTRRPVCMLLAFLTIIAIIALVVVLVVPQLVSGIQLILAELPGALEFIVKKALEWNIISDNFAGILSSVDWQSRIGELIEIFTSGVGNIMNVAVKAVSSVFSGIISSILAIIFAVYLLAAKDKLKDQRDRVMNHYLKESWNKKISYVISVLDDCFHRYIVGQCTEAGVLGVLCTFGMMLLGLPYPTMIGALVAFTALIPVAGSYIGAAVGAFMILTVSPIEALFFLIFIVVLQQLEGNLIYPKVVGSSIGLPGIWVLAAVTVGGGIMGVLGMLLGVPVAAAIYKLIRDDVNGVSPLRN